jgi:hypothetical protein
MALMLGHEECDLSVRCTAGGFLLQVLAAVVAQDQSEGVGGGKIPAFTTGYGDGELVSHFLVLQYIAVP